jgi:hypothetical protein
MTKPEEVMLAYLCASGPLGVPIVLNPYHVAADLGYANARSIYPILARLTRAGLAELCRDN